MGFAYPVVKYSLIFCGVGVGSELVYHLIKYLWPIREITINEVLFSNNKSGCCRSKTFEESNCKNKYCISKNLKRMIELFDAAQSTICLSMYIFTCQELSDALIRAKKRGVLVRVIGEKSMAFSSGSQLSNFPICGIPVKFHINSEMLMHHKFCLLDAKFKNHKDANDKKSTLPKNGVLMTGSMNWTMQALSGNWDNFIITSDEELINQFILEFESMWQGFKTDVD